MDMVICVSRAYHFKFFKGCLPQILLGTFLNILTHMSNLTENKSFEHFFISFFVQQRQFAKITFLSIANANTKLGDHHNAS